MSERVAIIGAGVAGMAAAHLLDKQGFETEVFEKSRGFSGRAATRMRNGVIYDHGANFFRLEDDEVAALIQSGLPSADLVEIVPPVWTFDRHGVISPGDPASNAIPKWTYRHGISSIGKLLHEASPKATTRLQTHVNRIERNDGHWWLTSNPDLQHGPFRAILVTLSAPQARVLLEADQSFAGLAELLGMVVYHSQFSFVFGWEHRVMSERPYHALVNLDRGHDIAWLSFEEDKPGHVPDDQSVMVVQMAPPWSLDHFEKDPNSLMPAVWQKVRNLIATDLPDPSWWDSQRWKFAHPAQRLERKTLAPWESQGLFYAGDALAGKGRVTLSIKEGLVAGRKIIGHLQ